VFISPIIDRELQIALRNREVAASGGDDTDTWARGKGWLTGRFIYDNTLYRFKADRLSGRFLIQNETQKPTKLMKNTLNSVMGKLAAVVAFLMMIGAAQAQTNFYDDFEEGNVNNWTVAPSSAAMPLATGTNAVPTNGNYSIEMTNSLCKVYANLPSVITAESMKYTVYYYDDSGTAARAYGETRSYTGGSYAVGGLSQDLMIGKYNSVSLPGEVYDGTKYQGRMADGTLNGYFNLNLPGCPNRKTGWHKLQIEQGLMDSGDLVISFYVDGVLGRVFTNNDSPAWNVTTLGSVAAGTTAGNAWFDGVQVVSGETYITTQPVGVTNQAGNDITLSVNAIGDAGALSYQWYQSGTNLAGATTAMLTITNAQPSNSGNYTVTVSNYLDIKTSVVAPVLVTPLPTTTISISLGGTNVILNWTGSHTLQSAPAATGPFNAVPGPILTGPYTNNVSASAQFFRLLN
jgi:hypothetical protein